MRWKILETGGGGGGGTNDGVCISIHMLGGSGGHAPPEKFEIRCSEIASEAIFVPKCH